MRRSAANGVSGVCTRPGSKVILARRLWDCAKALPAVRLAIEDAEILELRADIGLALRRRGRQRRAGRADGAAHDHHAALERGGVLVFEQVPQPRHLELQLARAIPLAGDAAVEQLIAQVRTDRAG